MTIRSRRDTFCGTSARHRLHFPTPMGETTSEPDDIIGSYLANVRGTVPLAIEQIDAILRLIAAARDPVRSFLDLSCDGGTIIAAVLDEHPRLEAVLIEDSARRLE